jgi:4-amino-4-deoxy-L-arabinose transferase-like glycosyltransferase
MAQQPLSSGLYDQFVRGWRGYVLIGLIAILSAQFGAGRMQVMDADEARFAQATRQMVETGDYVSIQLQDEERNRKPIGVHWLQAAAVNALKPFTERTNEIWPYRLPSTLGLLIAALATYWGGATLIGQRPAFFGASLFAASLLAGFEGMTAKTDALLLGFTTLAMAALAHLRMQQGNARFTALIFWSALGCGVMIKGPVAPLVAALTLGALTAWERRAAWMKPLAWWPGPLLAFIIVAPWSIAISLETDGRFFSGMVLGDLLPKLVGGHEDHFALPGYHLFLLPFLIFPLTYALPAAARLAFRTVRAGPNDEERAPLRFLLAWSVLLFILFELTPTKLPHYVLPAYPAIALLCGLGLVEMQRWRTVHPAGVVMYAVSGLVIAGILAFAATFMPGDFSTDLRRAISSALIGVGIVAFAFVGLIMLRRPAARAAILCVSTLLLSFSLRERLLPEARAINVSNEAVAALTRARLMPNDERTLWVIGYGETSLVFLTRTSIHLATIPEAVAGALIGDALIIEGRALQDAAAAFAVRGLTFTPSEEPVRGFALGRGEQVALFVGTLSPNDAPEAGQLPRP